MLSPDERCATEPATAAVLPTFLSPAALDLASHLDTTPTEAPVPVIPETALQACMVRAPLFLRAARCRDHRLGTQNRTRHG